MSKQDTVKFTKIYLKQGQILEVTKKLSKKGSTFFLRLSKEKAFITSK